VKLPGAKAPEVAEPVATATTSTATAEPKDNVSDAVEKLATMHELLKQGAISQAEYDKKKAELLSRI
jgi:Short C-terminal domain